MNEQLTNISQAGHEAEMIMRDMALTAMLNLFPVPVAIVNDQRQVLFVNDAMREEFKLPPQPSVVGKRPGELFKCSHVQDSNFKCGTSEWCCYCGISNAVKTSIQTGKMAEEECVVSGIGFNSRCMRVMAQPYSYQNNAFTMLVFQDVSEAYRRSLLERVFFHDIRNMVMMLMSSAILKQRKPEALKYDFTDYVLRIAEHMKDEISAQQEMIAAESNRLETIPAPIHSLELIHEIIYFFEKAFFEQHKTIIAAEDSVDVVFVSDVRLVRRTIINMVKNALEATDGDAVITLRSGIEDEYVRLSVHNPGLIAPEVQMQLFQQAFSTKGTGRGMGTYSMKLLTEKYLSGHVGFISTPTFGTEFFAAYPINGIAQ